MLPQLKEDPSIETITIYEALNVDLNSEIAKKNIYGLHLGSIIVHSSDKITRVFDRCGNQILSIDDEKSGKERTPAGIEKTCTRVYQIPNDSKIYEQGNKTYVISPEGELILLIIDNDTSDNQNSRAVKGWPNHDWLVAAEDTSVDFITEYTAYWTVPSPPPSLEDEEIIYLFNGILGTSGEERYLLQPVLIYNPRSDRWEGQAWACNTNGNNDFKAEIFAGIRTGDTMKGRIYWSDNLDLWSVTLYDQTTGGYSSLSTNSIVPQNNCEVGCVLEGWYVDDNTDVPGDTLFYDMIYKSYGQSMGIYLKQYLSSDAPREITGYCYADIIRNPSKVRLNTAN